MRSTIVDQPNTLPRDLISLARILTADSKETAPKNGMAKHGRLLINVLDYQNNLFMSSNIYQVASGRGGAYKNEA